MLGEIDVCWMFQRAQYDRLVLVRGAAYLATVSIELGGTSSFLTTLWSEKCYFFVGHLANDLRDALFIFQCSV